MDRDILLNLVILLSLFLLVFSLAGCRATGGGIGVGWDTEQGSDSCSGHGQKAKGGPPPHAPAHGYRAKHIYHYYPHAQVYFDISRDVYFYMEGDNWRMSASLPGRLHVQLGDYVNIEMDSDKPYTHFKDHKKKYPPGELKKGKGKKKW